MKAKEYFTILENSLDPNDLEHEEFYNKLEGVMNNLIDDIMDLIEKRKAKSFSAINSIASEVNNKWHVIVKLSRQSEKFRESRIILIDDGLYACICKKHPHMKKYFGEKYLRVEKLVDNHEKEQERLKEEHERAMDNFYIHHFKPLNEITNENIINEILSATMAFGSYINTGIPVERVRGVAYNISFLRYWKHNGINYDEITPFKADQKKFIDEVIIPLGII